MGGLLMAGLIKKRVSIPLGGGLDVGAIDPKLPHASILKAENAIYTREGAIDKRLGLDLAGTLDNLNNDNKSPTFLGETFVSGKPSKPFAISRRLTVGGKTSFPDSGTNAPNAGLFRVKSSPLPSGGLTVNAVDMFASSGVTVVAYSAFDGTNHASYYAAYRVTTMALLYRVKLANTTHATNIRCPRIISNIDNGKIYVIYTTTTPDIRYVGIDPVVGPVTAGLLDSAVDGFSPDADWVGGASGSILLAYRSTGGALQVGQFTSAEAYSNATVATGLTYDVYSVKRYTDGTALYCWAETSGATTTYRQIGVNHDKTFWHASTVVATGTNVTPFSIVAYLPPSDATETTSYCIYTEEDASNFPVIKSVQLTALTTSPAAGSASALIYDMHLESMPITDSATETVTIGATSKHPTDYMFFLNAHQIDSRDADAGVQIGKSENRNTFTKLASDSVPLTSATIPVDATEPGRYSLAGLIDTLDGNFSIVRRDVTPLQIRLATAPLRGGAVVANSLAYDWDGSSLVEQGFTEPPAVPVLAEAAGGVLDTTALYTYQVVYEWVDGLGRLHQSTPSPAASFTLTGANRQFDVTVKNLHMTRKPNVQIALYRSLGDGNLLYRVTEVANDPGSDTQVVNDNNADATISSNGVLYTDGGELPDVQPPPYEVFAIHQDRQFVAHIDRQGSLIRYSKPFVSFRGIQHSDALEISIDPGGGDITGMVSAFGLLWVFKVDRVFAIAGEGLDNTGNGQNYARPRLVTSEVGCLDHRSLVTLPDGLAFLSANGIVKLEQGGQVNRIGQRVKYHVGTDMVSADTDEFPRAVTIPRDDQAIWFFPDGPALVYNYHRDRWSTWTNHLANDAVVVDNELFIVNGDSGGDDAQVRVRASDYNDYVDDITTSDNVSLTVETRPISLAGIDRLQRVYDGTIIGQAIGGSVTVSVAAAFSHDPNFQPARTYETSENGKYFDHTAYYDDTGFDSSYDASAFFLRYRLAKTKLGSVRFRISDDGDSANEGISLSEISLRVGVQDDAQVSHLDTGRSAGGT
jgi:hypothetical protein